MRFVEQTRHGYPLGNCMAACLASILDLDLRDVPEMSRNEDIVRRFGFAPHPDMDLQDWAIAAWLEPQGYQVFSDYPWCGAVWEIGRPDLSGLVIGYAWSKRTVGVGHAVVLLDGALVWDPSPRRAVGIGPVYGWLVLERGGRRLRP